MSNIWSGTGIKYFRWGRLENWGHKTRKIFNVSLEVSCEIQYSEVSSILFTFDFQELFFVSLFVCGGEGSFLFLFLTWKLFSYQWEGEKSSVLTQ